MLGLPCFPEFSLAAMREGATLVQCSGFSIPETSLIAGTGSRLTGSRELGTGVQWSTPRLPEHRARVVVVHELSCSEACSLPRLGIEPMSAALAGGISSTVPGGPLVFFSCIQLFCAWVHCELSLWVVF